MLNDVSPPTPSLEAYTGASLDILSNAAIAILTISLLFFILGIAFKLFLGDFSLSNYFVNRPVKERQPKTVADFYQVFCKEVAEIAAGGWVPRSVRIEITKTFELLTAVWKVYKKGILTVENVYLFESLVKDELPDTLRAFINIKGRPNRVVTSEARKQLVLIQSGLAKIVDDVDYVEEKAAKEKTLYLMSKINAFNPPANSLTLTK